MRLRDGAFSRTPLFSPLDFLDMLVVARMTARSAFCLECRRSCIVVKVSEFAVPQFLFNSCFSKVGERTMRHHIRLALVVVVVSALTAAGARADSFAVTNVPDSTTNFGVISPTANYQMAIDLNGTGETINGVTFVSGGTSGSEHGLNYTLTGATTPFGGYNNSATDTNVHSLLSNFFYGGNPATFTVGGLTPNLPYQITLFGAAYGNDAVGNRVEDLTGGNGGATIAYEENNGMLSTLTYTAFANGSGQISFTSTPVESGNTEHFYGFAVAPVPEPASVVALLGLCGMGLAAVVWRRRKAA
jgi:hypothetical protein